MLSRACSFPGTILTRSSFGRYDFSLCTSQRTKVAFAIRAVPVMTSLSDEEYNGEGGESSPANLNDSETGKLRPPPQKQHTLSLCMVPPPSATQVWADVTKARIELKDPGLFRWPPHANILYPFVEIKHDLEDIVVKLRNATKQCPPFRVSLNTLGTFGGKSRGVLWLYPNSCYDDGVDGEIEPLIQLQAMLQEQFPVCNDQRKNGQYNPHMTLGHFSSLEEAQNAQAQLESWWSARDATFDLNAVYLLQRKGDDSQFLRVATLSLGDVDSSSGILIHDPPEAFPDMPNIEEDWVKEERMKLKERRNYSWKGQRQCRGGSRRSSRGQSKSTDTPDIIAAKRATRKAKRERLEREQLEKESDKQ